MNSTAGLILEGHQRFDRFVIRLPVFLYSEVQYVSIRVCRPFVGGAPTQNAHRTPRTVAARTPESDALSKDLKQRGFSFVGSTICYAFMQAVGMVNDHLVTCVRYRELR